MDLAGLTSLTRARLGTIWAPRCDG